MIRKSIIALTLTSADLITGCNGGLFTGGETPSANVPQAPVQPVVVEGMRTSYADIVERTSPAVVRIEADHREKTPTRGQSPGMDDFFRQLTMHGTAQAIGFVPLTGGED